MPPLLSRDRPETFESAVTAVTVPTSVVKSRELLIKLVISARVVDLIVAVSASWIRNLFVELSELAATLSSADIKLGAKCSDK